MHTRCERSKRTARRAMLSGGIAAVAMLATAGQAFADSVSLSVTTTTGASDPVAGVSRIFTLSGTSAVANRVWVKYRAPGGAACAPSASQDSGEPLFREFSSFYGTSVNGAFSLQEASTWSEAGTLVFCYWLSSSSSDIATPFTQTITFRRPTGTITASINPIAPRPGQAATVTVTGASESVARVFAKVRPAGGAPCAATYSSDTGDELLGGTEVNGAFSLPVSMTQENAGSYLLCLWLAGSSDDPTPIAGPQPQPFTVGVPPAPAPAPPAAVPPQRVSSTLTVTRRKTRRAGRYAGRLRTTRICRRNRVVVLRRVGSGARSFARSRTRADGTYTLKRSRRLRGRVYVVVAARRQGAVICASGRTRRIRG